MAFDLSSLGILVAALFVILISCEIFVNAIEWLGLRLGLADCATGSVLAAVGTAMPETIIPLIAIFLGSETEGEKIGEGAILGAPFMLSTLAMFVGGLAVMFSYRRKRRGRDLVVQRDHVERDLRFFILMYTLALLTGVLGAQSTFDRSYLNYAVAFVLFGVYALYLHRTLKAEAEKNENSCAPLYLSRVFRMPVDRGRIGFLLIILQVVNALMLIIIGAKLFVEEVETISASLGVPAMILAFLIAPIATELPEKFNSVIWYWRSKDTLALGNITGAMVFQSSFPVGIGLLFTEWKLEPVNIMSIIIALLAAGWILFEFRSRGRISYRVMLASGSLYVTYIIFLFLFGVL